MQSSEVYNGISWSGGIWSYWEWPPSPLSDYYDPNPLTAFDNFYQDRGLTRVGADSASNAVDLWATSGYVNGVYTTTYTHASIKAGGDANPHGYAWESKISAHPRIFHPRRSLRGATFGNVSRYYRRINASSVPMSLEEEIAEGTRAMECVSFADEEQQLIGNWLESLPQSVTDRFLQLYGEWRDWTKEAFCDNPYLLTGDESYKRLISFCKEHGEVLPLVYKRLGEGDLLSVLLTEDLLVRGREDILDEVRAYNKKHLYTEKGAKIVRTPISNSISFVKRMLATELPDSHKISEERQYSNTDHFSVRPMGTALDIQFPLEFTSKVSVVVSDIEGREIQTVVDDIILGKGNHTVRHEVHKPGIYLVRFVLNGNVNVKKIIL